jgi:predicted molibdopterin-dependent oxidoreductase YjgC
MTRRAAGIAELFPEERLEINPADAERLGLNDGEMVDISSRRGKIRVKGKLTERSQHGVVFLAFHHQNALTNILTSSHKDPITGTPEYKFSAVKIEKIALQ